ncbi:MAG: hypothetical protein JWQ81_8501 [Amycolatopsis sp.]|uniref:hypothetical protein n=1 Tax=Amycolatopsis sp. TaxID=37632 RepID=UPI00260AF116|nr:hypothetical protein [Amycolatopsis sp.]MCU1687762.1 hypothetical protein [Amycolatopsis sp.]
MTDPLREAIEAIPEVAEMLNGGPVQHAVADDLITAYIDSHNRQMDALIGDIDNWKPTGILGPGKTVPR